MLDYNIWSCVLQPVGPSWGPMPIGTHSNQCWCLPYIVALTLLQETSSVQHLRTDVQLWRELVAASLAFWACSLLTWSSTLRPSPGEGFPHTIKPTQIWPASSLKCINRSGMLFGCQAHVPAAMPCPRSLASQHAPPLSLHPPLSSSLTAAVACAKTYAITKLE